MKRMLAVAVALGVSAGMTGLALAQPVYGPNGTTYNPYAAPPPPPPAAAAYPPPAYATSPYQDQGTHTSGGASRAYWGGQKSN